jgi:hypothetical protein
MLMVVVIPAGRYQCRTVKYATVYSLLLFASSSLLMNLPFDSV